MRGNQIGIVQLGHGGVHVASQRSEEVVCQRHAATLIAQQPFTTIFRIGFAADVTGFDHPVDEVGDSRRGYVHAFPELCQCQRLARGLSHHDVQQGMKVIAAHLVEAGEMTTHPVGLGGDRTNVGRELPLELSPIGRWFACSPFGHLHASFIRHTIRRPGPFSGRSRGWLPGGSAAAMTSLGRDPSSSASSAMLNLRFRRWGAA